VSAYLLILFFALQSVPSPVTTIVINELQIAPDGGASEFIELYNGGPEVVRLDQLTISDARDLDGTAGAAPSTTMHPGEYIVLVPDTDRFEGQAGAPLIDVSPWPSLNNSGDRMSLRLNGNVVDSLTYSEVSYERGRSLERIDPAKPAFLADNWSPSTNPDGSTPGYVNSVFLPDTEAPDLDAAAFRDPNLIQLFFSEPIPPLNSGLAIIRIDSHPVPGDSMSIHSSMISLRSEGGAASVSVSGVVDWAGNEIVPVSRPIALRPRPGDIRINEIMYDPDTGVSSDPEYIELCNRADYSVALSGLSLLTRTSAVKTSRSFDLGSTVHVLPSNGLAVIYNEPVKARMDLQNHESSLESSYPATITAKLPFVLLPQSGTSLGLVNTGMDVVLKSHESGLNHPDAPGTSVIDSISYSPDWHDKRWLTNRGRSLALVRNCVSTNPAFCWTSTTTVSGATPGLPYQGQRPGPSASEYAILFNELMVDPIADLNDSRPDQTEFVELANISDGPIDINGVYLLRERGGQLLPDSIRLVYRPTIVLPGDLTVIAYIPPTVGDIAERPEVFLTTGFQSTRIDYGIIPLRVHLNLPSEGALLRLMSNTGGLLDELFYHRSWHHPSIASSKGVSLERIDLRASSTSPDNWTTSLADGGATPARTNSVALNRTNVTSTPSARPGGWKISPETISPDNNGRDDRMEISLTGYISSFGSVLTIYDLAGRQVKKLFPVPGEALIFIWDGSGVRRTATSSGLLYPVRTSRS